MFKRYLLAIALSAATAGAVAAEPNALPGTATLQSILDQAGIKVTAQIQNVSNDCTPTIADAVNSATVIAANVHHLGNHTYSWRYFRQGEARICAWLDSPMQGLLTQAQADLLETASATVTAQRDAAPNSADGPTPQLVASSARLAFSNGSCATYAGSLFAATAIAPNVAITAGSAIPSQNSPSCVFENGRPHHVLSAARTSFSGTDTRRSVGLVQFQNALTLASYPRLEFKTYTGTTYPNELYEFFSVGSTNSFSYHNGYIATNIPNECSAVSFDPGLLVLGNINTFLPVTPTFGGAVTYGGSSVIRGIYTHGYACSSPGGNGYPAFNHYYPGAPFLNEGEHRTLVQQYLNMPAPTQSVTVTSPAFGAHVFAKPPLVLAASVSGAPANAQLIWSSNVQGALGTGNPLTVSLTVPGTHVLTAKLSTDNRVAHTVVVNVELVPTVSLTASPSLLQLAPNTAGSTTISWGSARNELQKLTMFVSRDNAPFVQFEGNNIAGSTGSSTINWIVGGSQYVFVARGKALGGTEEREFARVEVRTEAPPCNGATPQADGWYTDSAKVGTAVQMARRGNELVFGWLTYTSGGSPVWYFGQPTRDACGIYQGSIRQYTRSPNGSTTSTVVAQIKVRFTDAKNAQFTYKFGTEERTVSLNSFEFGTGSGPNMTGFYADSARPNSGSYIISQGGTHVAALYFYSNSGVATWAFGSKSSQIDGQINGIRMVKYRGTGRCPLCTGAQNELVPEDLGGLTIHRVGSNAQFNGDLLGVGINWPFAWVTMGAL